MSNFRREERNRARLSPLAEIDFFSRSLPLRSKPRSLPLFTATQSLENDFPIASPSRFVTTHFAGFRFYFRLYSVSFAFPKSLRKIFSRSRLYFPAEIDSHFRYIRVRCKGSRKEMSSF